MNVIRDAGATCSLAKRWLLTVAAGACVSIFCPPNSYAADEFETAPIRYSSSQPNDSVYQLWQQLQSGSLEIEGRTNLEKLDSLLKLLDIPVSSQVLVFSKTSLQISKIGPRTPRALYFNEHTYVGYVPSSKVIELVSVDANLGSIFYTVEPLKVVDTNISPKEPKDAPEVSPLNYEIVRDRGQCLSCHASVRTERVPGTLIRSIYSDKAGRPRSGASTFSTDHRSPFEQRWGGWYVTGEHGAMRHMGNMLALDRENPEKLDMDGGANWSSLPNVINPRSYLTDTSDIVSLMVLEHQSHVQNLITRANFETRQAIHLDETMNLALERPKGHRSDSTIRRIKSAANELVKALLLVDEFPLSNAVVGNSSFTLDFMNRGIKTSGGNSLNELDLDKRLFVNACSYLVLSDQLEALPSEVKKQVIGQVVAVLKGSAPPPGKVLWDDSARIRSLEILSTLRPHWIESGL